MIFPIGAVYATLTRLEFEGFHQIVYGRADRRARWASEEVLPRDDGWQAHAAKHAGAHREDECRHQGPTGDMKLPVVLALATWILSRLVPEGEREPLMGDLEEEYALRVRADSSYAPRVWYLRQICSSIRPSLGSGSLGQHGSQHLVWR